MCELFCLSSRAPTTATFSLQRFAARGGVDGNLVDGWGLAFYAGRDVRLYREPEPAGDSPWLDFIERRRIPSTLVLSHLRHATHGAVSLGNTQPFARELGGRAHCFAHNGKLPGVERLQGGFGRRFEPIGDSDSEVAFCVLLQQVAPLWSRGDVPPLGDRLAVVARCGAELRALGPANFLYADGDVVFAHGDRRTQPGGVIAPPGLWRLQRNCAVDRDALAASGVTIEDSQEPQRLTLLASVPLSREPWLPFARGELIAVRHGEVCAPATDDDPDHRAMPSIRAMPAPGGA